MIYKTFIQIPFYQYIKSYKSVTVGDAVYHWQGFPVGQFHGRAERRRDVDLHTATPERLITRGLPRGPHGTDSPVSEELPRAQAGTGFRNLLHVFLPSDPRTPCVSCKASWDARAREPCAFHGPLATRSLNAGDDPQRTGFFLPLEMFTLTEELPTLWTINLINNGKYHFKCLPQSKKLALKLFNPCSTSHKKSSAVL